MAAFIQNKTQQIFESDGIVAIPLLNETEIDELLAFYQETSQNVSDKKFHSTMFINDRHYRKQTDERIRALLGNRMDTLLNNYRLLFANFITKESSDASRVGIHQDWNFTSPEFISLNLWIPLIDINEHTGVFYALKGSHKTFRNIRYTPYEDGAYLHLENYIRENSTPLTVKAGTALIYHGALVHFSDPNISGKPRIAVGCAFIPSSSPNLHYYRPHPNERKLEVYEVNEDFYCHFDFFNEPKAVTMVGTLMNYAGLPTLEELILNDNNVPAQGISR